MATRRSPSRRCAGAPRSRRPAIYARTTTKEALFLAVYEHGIARLRADRVMQVGTDSPAALLGPAELVRELVAGTVRMILRHRRFLGAVVLISASHAEVRRRGSDYSRELGAQFAAILRPASSHFAHGDVDGAVSSCFSIVFASAIFRVAYGSDFATYRSIDDATFVLELCITAERYLLPGHSGR